MKTNRQKPLWGDIKKNKRSLLGALGAIPILGQVPWITDFFGSLLKPMLKQLKNRSKVKQYNNRLIDKFIPNAFLSNKYSKSEGFKNLLASGQFTDLIKQISEAKVTPGSYTRTKTYQDNFATITQILHSFDTILQKRLITVNDIQATFTSSLI